MNFTSYLQRDAMDCGPTCIKMVAKHYGKNIQSEALRQATGIGNQGVNLLGLAEAAEAIGFRTEGVRVDLNQLNIAKLPCILHWNQEHFVVLYKVRRRHYFVADPASGLFSLTEKEFIYRWMSIKTSANRSFQESQKNPNQGAGIALLLEPSPAFFADEFDKQFAEKEPQHFKRLAGYILPYKKLVLQLFLGVILGSLLQLVLPFLTQSIVDTGINTNNIHFIYIILLAQTALLAGRLSVDFIRGWILYYISSRINIGILTDFLAKLMKLPMSFFEAKQTGDIMQRMNDHHRIQDFLTGTSLNTLFSLFSLVTLSVAMVALNPSIFLTFLIASLLYVGWIILFLKKRKQLDYKRFDISSAEQSKTIQLVQGMQQIKLHGCETQKRWEWERLQAKLFKLGVKGLALNQWQQAGAFFINEGKNIFITFLAATAVIKGDITLGGMLAIQYMMGQLNAPIEQMIGFAQSWQLAKISLDRLNEVYEMQDEESPTLKHEDANKETQYISRIPSTDLPDDKTFTFSNVSFTYPGAGNEPVLRDINCTIPAGKITALVGASGSGKTTLLKLLLKYYDPQKGEIKLGGNNIENISHKSIRMQSGVVMQDGFVFSDSIAGNIAVGEERPSPARLKQAVHIANIASFIDSLPLGYNTRIGAEGMGISGGQKQRVMIARAVYKDPAIVLFDEATNALDASNESIIIKNLNEFFKHKTTIVVAHRLSTVKNADQIIVLNNGMISETGNHQSLTALRGEYYSLVKDQLELGN